MMMRMRYPQIEIRSLYDKFDAPLVPLDCGGKCAPHNSSGKPFCCDICHAVPAAYHQEWSYLQPNTELWHLWRGDECVSGPEDPANLQAETPDSMVLLACLGPDQCQRDYRALSCRQFPFFPYITADYRFLGLAYEWEFEDTCWVISNLGLVTEAYRQEFVQTYDDLFSAWMDEMEGYAAKSEEMRIEFITRKRRIPILHRNGGFYLLSPVSERLYRIKPEKLPRFGVYRYR
jgi:hypothetical protein